MRNLITTVVGILLSTCSFHNQISNESHKVTFERDQLEQSNVVKPLIDEQIWVPSSVERCLSSTGISEEVIVAQDFNPFYLRVDFDGDKRFDLAVIVKGKQSKRIGVALCLHSGKASIFGNLAPTSTESPFFENDNFVNDNWEVLTNSEIRKMRDHSGRIKIAKKAKGEAVGFFFEGGSHYIFWDGTRFVNVDGM
jgi:hypothetical protein